MARSETGRDAARQQRGGRSRKEPAERSEVAESKAFLGRVLEEAQKRPDWAKALEMAELDGCDGYNYRTGMLSWPGRENKVPSAEVTLLVHLRLKGGTFIKPVCVIQMSDGEKEARTRGYWCGYVRRLKESLESAMTDVKARMKPPAAKSKAKKTPTK